MKSKSPLIESEMKSSDFTKSRKRRNTIVSVSNTSVRRSLMYEPKQLKEANLSADNTEETDSSVEKSTKESKRSSKLSRLAT